MAMQQKMVSRKVSEKWTATPSREQGIQNRASLFVLQKSQLNPKSWVSWWPWIKSTRSLHSQSFADSVVRKREHESSIYYLWFSATTYLWFCCNVFRRADLAELSRRAHLKLCRQYLRGSHTRAWRVQNLCARVNGAMNGICKEKKQVDYNAPRSHAQWSVRIAASYLNKTCLPRNSHRLSSMKLSAKIEVDSIEIIIKSIGRLVGSSVIYECLFCIQNR